MTEIVPELVQIEHATYEQAFSAAAQEASTTMATIAPVILYNQGNRSFITTSFPMLYIDERVRIDTLARGGNADEHYNRPLIPEHCRAITEYLVTQDDYVLPPLSLCVEKMIRCHILQSSSAVKMGVAVLPTSILYNITDGQHRCRAIHDALTSKVNLGDDGIGVTIVVEHDLSKVHQIFYDCAQNRSIPQSLLTVYNGRDHLARLVRDICKEVPIFAGRIEQVSKTVGKSSINIFTLNQLRTGVAELLTGDSSQGNISLKKEMTQRLGSDQAFLEHKKWVIDFFNGFTSANREWSHILESGEPALGVVDTSELRQRYVNFTGTGLIVLGRVGYSIRNLSQYERERLIDALAKKIDWSRDGEIWRGNIVIDNKMNSQRAPVGIAVERIKEQLGIVLSETEQKRVSRRSAK
jgi:DGQHR domain-containing protein